MIPDTPGPITGYRCWNSDGAYLEAIGGSWIWRPSVNKAHCLNLPNVYKQLATMPNPAFRQQYLRMLASHQPAEQNCMCGFWAYSNLDTLIDERGWPNNHGMIYGTVSMWGRVAEFEKGYRSEHARVTGIYDTGPRSRRVAMRYQVPLLELPKTKKKRPRQPKHLRGLNTFMTVLYSVLAVFYLWLSFTSSWINLITVFTWAFLAGFWWMKR
jgi:hypothetical protein